MMPTWLPHPWDLQAGIVIGLAVMSLLTVYIIRRLGIATDANRAATHAMEASTSEAVATMVRVTSEAIIRMTATTETAIGDLAKARAVADRLSHHVSEQYAPLKQRIDDLEAAARARLKAIAGEAGWHASGGGEG